RVGAPEGGEVVEVVGVLARPPGREGESIVGSRVGLLHRFEPGAHGGPRGLSDSAHNVVESIGSMRQPEYKPWNMSTTGCSAPPGGFRPSRAAWSRPSCSMHLPGATG